MRCIHLILVLAITVFSDFVHGQKPLCLTCNPTSGLNKCDISTSCITTSPSGEHYCACRAGFKANAPDLQIATHHRLDFPGQEYRVFVAPGVECNTLCNNPFGAPQDICTEIPVVTASTCELQVCGNGILETGEECDDGNLIDGDGCTSKCKNQVCGNGVVEPGEECDDGNLINNDGCSSTCKLESKPLCLTCNPTSGLNKCDISTSCITTFPSGKHYCACRAGFKANAPDSQIAIHYRLNFPGQEYRVFVAPGVECNTLCNNPFGAPQDICTEIQVVAQCN